jgi:hypothetical protein
MEVSWPPFAPHTKEAPHEEFPSRKLGLCGRRSLELLRRRPLALWSLLEFVTFL